MLEPFHIDLRIAFKLFWVLVSNLVSLGALVLVDRNRILQHGYNKIFDSFLVILGKLPILFFALNFCVDEILLLLLQLTKLFHLLVIQVHIKHFTPSYLAISMVLFLLRPVFFFFILVPLPRTLFIKLNYILNLPKLPVIIFFQGGKHSGHNFHAYMKQTTARLWLILKRGDCASRDMTFALLRCFGQTNLNNFSIKIRSDGAHQNWHQTKLFSGANTHLSPNLLCMRAQLAGSASLRSFYRFFFVPAPRSHLLESECCSAILVIPCSSGSVSYLI